ncbi:hypothetical protein [Paenibacillus marinisediminis]
MRIVSACRYQMLNAFGGNHPAAEGRVTAASRHIKREVIALQALLVLQD